MPPLPLTDKGQATKSQAASLVLKSVTAGNLGPTELKANNENEGKPETVEAGEMQKTETESDSWPKCGLYEDQIT